MLVETLLARGEEHEREPKEEEEEYGRTTKERARDSYVSANITGKWKKAEREKEEDKKRKEKKKSKEESFTPCMTRRKFARERSALAMRFIMRSRKRVHVCTYAVARFRKSGSRQIVLRDKF